jgi:hypothetical protein
MKFVFAFIVAALLALPARADEGIAGQWSGTWTKNGDALPVLVTFTRGDTMEVERKHQQVRFDTFAGSFDSDALQRSAIPFAQVVFAGGHVHFELIGDEAATMFDGTLAGDVLTGMFQDARIPACFA